MVGTPQGDEIGVDEPGSDNDASLRLAWKKLESEWQDENAHKRFIALAQTLKRLDFAGKCFREVKEKDASRAERAQQSIDAIVTAAMANMHLQQPTFNRDDIAVWRRRLTFVAVAVMIIIMAVAVFGFISLFEQNP